MSAPLHRPDQMGFDFDVKFDFDDFPTSTVHQSRLRVFEPTRRPRYCQRDITTPWGTASVTGKLGQGHADVLEAMCHELEDWRRTEKGAIELLIDPYKLRKTANGGKLGSGTQVDVILFDLMQAILDIGIPKHGLRVRGHIIDEIVDSKVTKPSHGFGKDRKQGEERHLSKVTLGRAFVGLVGGDLHLHYDPSPIAALQYGVSQAIARHIATHKTVPPGGWHLDTLIDAVGAGEAGKLGNRRRELRKDAEGLRGLGILIEERRVRREGRTEGRRACTKRQIACTKRQLL